MWKKTIILIAWIWLIVPLLLAMWEIKYVNHIRLWTYGEKKNTELHFKTITKMSQIPRYTLLNTLKLWSLYEYNS